MPPLYPSVSGASAGCLTRLPFPELLQYWGWGGEGLLGEEGRKGNKNQVSSLSCWSGTSKADVKLFLLLPPPANTSELLRVLLLCLLSSLSLVQSSQAQHSWSGDHVCATLVALHSSDRTEKQLQGKTKRISALPPPASASKPLKLSGCRSSTWAGATGSTQPLIFMDTGNWKRQNQTHQTSITRSQSQTVLHSSWMLKNSTLTPGHFQYFIPVVILGWT